MKPARGLAQQGKAFWLSAKDFLTRVIRAAQRNHPKQLPPVSEATAEAAAYAAEAL